MNSVLIPSGAARIAAVFQGKKALIGQLMGGDPTPQACLERAVSAVASGADALLIGIPFSDPVAESEERQLANARALGAGTTPDTVLSLAFELRGRLGGALPLLLVGYLNPVFHYGYDSFLARCAQAGVDGLLIVDLPVEERGELLEAARTHGVALLSHLAPAPPHRLAAVAEQAEGLLLIAGADACDPAALADLARAAGGRSRAPLVAPLGAATPVQAAAALKIVDGLVVDIDGAIVPAQFASISKSR